MHSLESIVLKLGADSAAIMAPNDSERRLYCYDSFNMPPEWVAIKNSYDEEKPGGNIDVYRTGKAAITNHLRIMLKGYFIESVMILPIRRKDRTIAMLELIHDKDNKIFTDADLEVAGKFAEELAHHLSV